jgi:hypothetical protein
MLTTFVEDRPVKRLKGEAESTSGEVCVAFVYALRSFLFDSIVLFASL